jgi:hypothetical protein
MTCPCTDEDFPSPDFPVLPRNRDSEPQHPLILVKAEDIQVVRMRRDYEFRIAKRCEAVSSALSAKLRMTKFVRAISNSRVSASRN